MLLVVHTRIFFPRMIELGEALVSSGKCQVTFHLEHKHTFNDLSTDIQYLLSKGFAVTDSTINSKGVSKRPKYGYISRKVSESILPANFYSITKKLWRFVRTGWPADFVYSLILSFKKKIEIVQLLKEQKPDIVVLVEVPTWHTSLYVRCCRDLKISSVIALCQGGFQEEVANAIYMHHEHKARSILELLIPNIYGKWVCEFKGKRLSMLRFGEIIAREVLGTAVPQPWIECSSNANVVLVENNAYLELSLKAGLVANNLRVTGFPYHDNLSRAIHDRTHQHKIMLNSHGLTESKPIIATALLPNYLGRSLANADFKVYEEMVAYWIEKLQSYSDYHTILSLHPSAPEHTKDFLKKTGVAISTVSTPELIAFSHIYVASLSSTLAMAAACGVPAVNYDWAHYEMRTYENALGIITVKSRQEFSDTLDKILLDTNCYQKILQRAASDRHNWGVLDGKATDRILNIFDALNP